MTKEIQEAICKQEITKKNFVCENVNHILSDFESDVLSLGKTYITEFEVKISRSDFLRDKTKKRWKFKNEKAYFNYFYYVCPSGLIDVSEIGEFHGLMYFDGGLRVIKKAKLIHKKILNRCKILEKFLRLSSERKYFGKSLITIKNDNRRKD